MKPAHYLLSIRMTVNVWACMGMPMCSLPSPLFLVCVVSRLLCTVVLKTCVATAVLVCFVWFVAAADDSEEGGDTPGYFRATADSADDRGS